MQAADLAVVVPVVAVAVVVATVVAPAEDLVPAAVQVTDPAVVPAAVGPVRHPAPPARPETPVQAAPPDPRP